MAWRNFSAPCHLGAADIAPPVRLGQSIWQRTRLPVELGRCVVDSARLGEGLGLVYSDYQPLRDLYEGSCLVREQAALTITIALQGRSSAEAAGQRFDFQAGHATLAAFASIRGERRFAAHVRTRQLRLVVEGPLLHQYGMAHLLHADVPLAARCLCSGPCTVAARQLADALVHLHQRTGGLLDLQVAALGLLAEQTRTLLRPASSGAAAPLRTHTRDKMLRARDLLLAHFDHPLTLAWICASVGTNECTLKSGFRACFGTSVQRMLTTIRMQKARELLHDGLPVSTVAWRVGYRHPSSFSTAFARYFGQPPKAYMNYK